MQLFMVIVTIKCSFDLQGEHKVFPSLQTFIKRKLRGIQTYFLTLLKLISKIELKVELH